MKKAKNRLGDILNFSEMYRCKGAKGVWTLRGSVNKSGMVGIMRFMSPNETKVVHARNLHPLDQYNFYTEAGFENLQIKDVFNNLDSGLKNIEDVVPNYDTELLTKSNFELVCSWYAEIKKKVEEFEILEENAKKEDKK